MAQTLIFTAPAQINSVKTLVDGTVKLDVAVAKELPADEMATLFEARKLGVGYFLFSPNPIEESAIPKEKADAQFDGKSPSQRMYNVLYLRWAQLTNQSQAFDNYYADQMNKIIARLKADLPERP
jgi:hypothetical protein